jgi:hypothetical protein
VTRTAAMPGRSEPGLANDISDPTGLKPLHWTTRERVWCRLRAAANRFRGRGTVVGDSWSRDCFLQRPGDCARGLVSDDGRYRATPFSADRFLTRLKYLLRKVLEPVHRSERRESAADRLKFEWKKWKN